MLLPVCYQKMLKTSVLTVFFFNLLSESCFIMAGINRIDYLKQLSGPPSFFWTFPLLLKKHIAYFYSGFSDIKLMFIFTKYKL